MITSENRMRILEKVFFYAKDGKVLKNRQGSSIVTTVLKALEEIISKNQVDLKFIMSRGIVIENNGIVTLFHCGMKDENAIDLKLLDRVDSFGGLYDYVDTLRKFKEDRTSSKKGINVGDTVEIVTNGWVYHNYDTMYKIMNRYCSSNAVFEKEFVPDNGKLGKVVYVCPHPEMSKILLGLECEDRFIVISEEGVKKVKKEVEIDKKEVTRKTFYEIMLDPKPNQIWESNSKRLIFEEHGMSIESMVSIPRPSWLFSDKTLYTLREEPKAEPKKLNIHEALKARAEGKTIRSCITNVTYNNKMWNNSIRIKEIEGEWIINE